MKILQVFPSLLKGGAERVVIELANGFVEAGHEVTLVLAFPVDPELNQNQLDNRVSIRYISLNSSNRIIPYVKAPFWILQNWRSIKRYSVVHCHLTFGLFFGFILALLRRTSPKAKFKLVATCHVVGISVAGFTRVFNERASAYFDEFVLMAQDDQWRNYAESKKLTNISVIVNGISGLSPEQAKKSHRQNTRWVIGTISRLQSERRPWLFLETFAEMERLMPGQLEFLIGGEGPERDSLLTQATTLGINSKLLMPGLVKEPATILKQLDLYLTLNVEQITGIAALEAIFYGVPAIGIQLSPSYTKGGLDWIWSDGNPKLVAAKAAEYLGDRKKLHELSREQEMIANEQFSISQMLNKYQALYEN